MLNIPRSFLREVDLRHGAAVALRGPSGMKWAAKVSRRPSDHRGQIRHGWGPFSVAHNLEEGDVCVFELTEHVYPMIDVHIFRVVEEITPLQFKEHKRGLRAGNKK
ncbi:B3 domain-containing protein Os11g0197600-like [Nymphaea colorata]|uniref:B3 domain-containing protein Os11g0197600-like n=1 Tax=Nymphaea colorata TaxID=210225 RepID=UPI00214EEFB9|nr:B3 domain-containing protein Os11g0197600-like [Nymphaea colorata]